MTVYFTASIVGKRHYLANYLRIIEVLKAKGFKVFSNHIIKSTEAQIRLETKEERLKFHAKLEKWINSCNFVVAETSFPSISVGYEISLALHFGKPVLILFSNGPPPSLLAHHRDEKLICQRYSEKTMPEIIDNFIKLVKETIDTRFTFFITREIAAHLEDISKKEKLPKAVYLRQLIEGSMKGKQVPPKEMLLPS